MKFPFLIASRYLFAKKSQNIINIISLISVVGIAVGTMALVIVLSVFNGLHGLVGSLYSNFDPDIKIVATQGKVFMANEEMLRKLNAIKGVTITSRILEDNALLKFDNRQVPATLMGVDSLFQSVSAIDSVIVDGTFQVKWREQNRGVIGSILADQLAFRINFLKPIEIFVPDRTKNVNLLNPESSFVTSFASPAGIFSVKQVSYDSQFLIINYQMAFELYKYPTNTVSYLALECKDGYENSAIKEIKTLLGNGFDVQNRQQQHQTFYKMMKVEKVMAYLILSFILMIATFNVIGTLSLLIFEKKESIQTLRTIGASQKTVIQIFLLEGGLITMMGIFGGLLLGVLLVILQQTLGIIQFSGGGAFIVNAYPVELQFGDIMLVLITVSTISILSVWYPVRTIVKKYYSNRQN